MPSFLTNWLFWAYAFVWLPFFLFVVLYATRSPWRSTSTGRALMTLGGSLTAVLTFVLFVIAVPISAEMRDMLRGATLGSVAIAGWMLLRELIRLQKTQGPEGDHPMCRTTDAP